MRTVHRLAALSALAFLLIGCGKKDSAAPQPGGGGSEPGGSAGGIEGTYLIVGMEMFGEKSSDDEIKKESEESRTVKITKDKIQMKLGSRRETGKYTIDSSKSPGTIDVTPPERPGGKGEKTMLGIYKVEGDTLTIAVMAKDETKRPKDFKTAGLKSEADDAAGMILTLKKVSSDTTLLADDPAPKPFVGTSRK